MCIRAIGLALLTLAALSGLPARARAAVACPPNIVKLGGNAQGNSYGARADTSFSFAFPTSGTDQVSYDLVSGTLAMSECCGPAETFVQTSDAYDVTGVPAGTPVTVTAMLTVDSDVHASCNSALLCGGALVDMQVTHGSDIASQQHSFTPPPQQMNWHDVLTAPVTIIAGTPEEIDFMLGGRQLSGSVGDGSDASGTISFSGLPAGASIKSCQGYHPIATPAHVSSWGRLKTLYR
jgi:hypothetical protein